MDKRKRNSWLFTGLFPNHPAQRRWRAGGLSRRTLEALAIDGHRSGALSRRADLVPSEVCGLSGRNMGRAADLHRAEVRATRFASQIR